VTSLSLDDILRARERIAHAIYLSPLIRSASLSRLAGAELHLKLENRQITGSFKERGALNRMLELSSQERGRGVIAASAGNHAQAVAYHARRLEIAATIVMPEPAPLTKVVNTRSHGAKVILAGQSYADAYTRASQLMKQGGATLLHAYDDPLVVAGQGTIGLELIEQEPELDAVVVPVGGGGLIAGIAVAVKALRPEIRVYGVETEGYAAARQSLAAGRRLLCGDTATLADGIAVPQVGEVPFEIMRRSVDEVVTVTEEEIASAILALVEQEKTVAEGAGAVSLAAILNGKLPIAGARVAAIVSGGNIDVNILSQVIERGLTRDGRRVRLEVLVPDRPGSLSRVTALIAQSQANVLEVSHERAFSSGPVGTSALRFTLETRGREHVDEVVALLRGEGFGVVEEPPGVGRLTP
jgi:threonine dehydratase